MPEVEDFTMVLKQVGASPDPFGTVADNHHHRLGSQARFRALDQMDLSPAEIPQRLIQQLFELDADCVEALWHSTNLAVVWIGRPCCVALWPLWNNSLPPVRNSENISPGAPTPHSNPWKPPSGKTWTLGKRTTWCPGKTPKTVKQPSVFTPPFVHTAAAVCSRLSTSVVRPVFLLTRVK